MIPGLSSVEHQTKAKLGVVRIGGGAHQSAPQDGDRSGALDPNRSPDSARVPGWSQRAGLERSGERALRTSVALRWAGHLDGEHVLLGPGQVVGDLEAVRNEVPRGVAEVVPVEPNLAPGHDPVEAKPGPPRWSRCLDGEPTSVEQGPIGLVEVPGLCPVTWHLDRRPGAVVEVGVGTRAVELGVERRRTPRAGEIHERTLVHSSEDLAGTKPLNPYRVME
jgi:hypothetical protein